MPCYHLTLKLTLLPLLGPDFGTKLTRLLFEPDFFFFFLLGFFLLPFLVFLVVFLVFCLLGRDFRVRVFRIARRINNAFNAGVLHINRRVLSPNLALGKARLTPSANARKSLFLVVFFLLFLTRDYPPHTFYEFSTQPHSP